MKSRATNSKRTKKRPAASDKKTPFVRVKLDFVIQMDAEASSLPSFASPDNILILIANGLSAVIPAEESVDILPGARMSTNLDFRSRAAVAVCCHGTKGCSGHGDKHGCQT